MPLIPGNKGARKINMNEKRLVHAYITSKFNKRQAGLVYDVKPQYASKLASEVLKRPVVQEYLQQQLDRAGLSLEDLNSMTSEAIHKGLEAKPTFSGAIDLIKHTYKLHNAVPANKTVSARINVNSTITPENIEELKKTLAEISKQNEKLLEELKK